MTREDVKKLFPDATDEQVTQFLNKHNSEIAGERAKTNSERQRANALQDEKDQRERDGMDELQKVQADLAAMQKTLESAQAENKKLRLTADLAQRGVTGESATKLVESISRGELDIEAMSAIIEEAKKTAIAAHEQATLHGTPDPKGDGGKGKDEDAVPEDVAFAQGISYGKVSEGAKAAREYYSK